MAEIVSGERTQGQIGPCDYGRDLRVLARSPSHALLVASGLLLWPRSHNHDGVRLAERVSRGTIIQAEDKINAVFGEGASDLIQQVVRQGTVLFEGGGDRLPMTTQEARGWLAFRSSNSVAYRADLSGRLKTCVQCGEDLKPHFVYHQLTHFPEADHPKGLEDCRRMTNHEVVGITPFDHPDSHHLVSSFQTWDGETFTDPHFCDDRCAAIYGRRAIQHGLVLPVGQLPEEYRLERNVARYDSAREETLRKAEIAKYFSKK